MTKTRILAGLTAVLCCFQMGISLTSYADEIPDEPATEDTSEVEGMGANFNAGDVNMNGNVDIVDVITINKSVLGKEMLSPVQNILADVNKDTTVDSSDSLALLKQIVGIQEEQPTLDFNTVNLSKDVKAETVTGKALDENFMQSQTGFYLNLFQQAEKESPDENILISPYSVIQALGMTANGADGSTKTEMEQTLGGIPLDDLNQYLYTQRISQPDSESCKLSTANSIWFRNDEGRIKVYPDFLQKNADYYNADAFKAPFNDATVTDINNWCKEKTDGMIPELLQQISEDAVMYLINAVAFDAKWESPYPEYAVNEADFTAWDGTVQKAKMMYSNEEYYYLEDDHATGFYKYYRTEKNNSGPTPVYAFAAILPEENLSVDEYISSLTADSLQKMLSEPTTVNVHTAMPKFSYDYEIILNQTLKKMGMPEAFTSAANFSKMAETRSGRLSIGKVVHKTHIDVDEAGTKAAAATMVEMTEGSVMVEPEHKTVTLDRPFVYMIVDMNTHLPVFMGAVKTLE